MLLMKHPITPDIEIKTDNEGVEEAAERIVVFLKKN